MLIFKKIKQGIDSVVKNLDAYKNDAVMYEQEVRKLVALKEILEYVKSYRWLTRRDAIAKVKGVLKADFNYKQVSDLTGVTVSSLQVSMSNASKLLEAKIGDTTIDLILNGEVEVAMVQFHTGTGAVDLSSLLISGVSDMLPPSENSIYVSVSECQRELEFLRSLTLEYVGKTLSALASDKLSLIRYILSCTDSRYSRQRGIILKFLSGEVASFSEVSTMLRDINIFEDIL